MYMYMYVLNAESHLYMLNSNRIMPLLLSIDVGYCMVMYYMCLLGICY